MAKVSTTSPPCSTAAAFCGAPMRLAVAGLGLLAAVEIADDDGYVAEALLGQPPGQLPQRRPARLDERAAQRQILDRIAGQHHFRERDQVRALLHGVPGPLEHRGGVAFQVADGGVDLIQGET